MAQGRNLAQAGHRASDLDFCDWKCGNEIGLECCNGIRGTWLWKDAFIMSSQPRDRRTFIEAIQSGVSLLYRQLFFHDQSVPKVKGVHAVAVELLKGRRHGQTGTDAIGQH